MQIFCFCSFESMLVIYNVHSFGFFSIVVLDSAHFYLRSSAGAKLHIAVITCTLLYILPIVLSLFLKMLIRVMCSLHFCTMLAICEVVGVGGLTNKL